MSERNKEAWKKIKDEGLSVDAQVFDNNEVYIGFVDNNRDFHHSIGKAKFGNSREARLAANATARAISRETGIPLHPEIPPERLKQVSSYTKNSSLLQWEFDARKRQEYKEWEESPAGKFSFVIMALLIIFIAIGGCAGLVYIMSLLDPK